MTPRAGGLEILLLTHFPVTSCTLRALKFIPEITQTQFEKRGLADIDWRRNSAFALFGCFYLGGVQYALYVPGFGRLFPKAAEFATKPFKYGCSTLQR